MSKIHEAFENGKAFIAFVTGGDPDLDTTKKIIKEMEKAGADLIEIGIHVLYRFNLTSNCRRPYYSGGKWESVGKWMYNR